MNPRRVANLAWAELLRYRTAWAFHVLVASGLAVFIAAGRTVSDDVVAVVMGATLGAMVVPVMKAVWRGADRTWGVPTSSPAILREAVAARFLALAAVSLPGVVASGVALDRVVPEGPPLAQALAVAGPLPLTLAFGAFAALGGWRRLALAVSRGSRLLGWVVAASVGSFWAMDRALEREAVQSLLPGLVGSATAWAAACVVALALAAASFASAHRAVARAGSRPGP